MNNSESSKMKGRIWKAALVMTAIAGWISIPLMNNSVEAGGVPILVRAANLVSPSGSINPHGFAEYQLYANGHREIEVEIEDVNPVSYTHLTACWYVAFGDRRRKQYRAGDPCSRSTRKTKASYRGRPERSCNERRLRRTGAQRHDRTRCRRNERRRTESNAYRITDIIANCFTNGFTNSVTDSVANCVSDSITDRFTEPEPNRNAERKQPFRRPFRRNDQRCSAVRLCRV